jgi:2,4-dienoyl-CoA reductase-like NADH-dependent reductase (Old Yellow Enzyme family)
MKTLFDTTTIGKITLKNRLVRSATWEGMADTSGHPSTSLFQVYEELARGGIGLIITGATTILPDATGLPGMMNIGDDSFIAEYQGLTSMIHQYDVPVVMQITYVGVNGTWPAAGDPTCHELFSIIRAFGDAAVRAKESGFDGVQFHVGHGYFISQFLNQQKNTRTDNYGGSVENRARFILEIYDEIRSRVGDDFGIFIKINCGEFQTTDDGVFQACQYTCQQLALRGIQAIEITGGVSGHPISPNGEYTESVFRDYAAIIADEIKVPVILVGLNRNPILLTELLNTTSISYFSLARPLIREPDLARVWQEYPETEAECTSCDACRTQDGVVCPFR